MLHCTHTHQLRRNDNDLAAALQSAIDKAINGNDGDNCTAVLIAFRRFEQVCVSV